jgi:hypothetical protein
MSTRTSEKPHKLRPGDAAELNDWPTTLRLGEDLRVKIDEWRRWQSDLPNRAVAVRRLLEIALYAESK